MIRRDIEIEARWFYWLCGLMEGEGTFTKATPSMPRRPRLSVRMADQDIIERVVEMTGTRIWLHEWKDKPYRTVYQTEVVGGSAVALMRLLHPEMCSRRQRQIEEAIATFQPLRSVRHKTYTILPVGEEERERYWLAGLLEGEASFGWSKLIKTLRLEMYSVDYNVVERVRSIWQTRYGISTRVRSRAPRKPGYQPQYQLMVYGDAARAVMADVAPLLGTAGGLREARACYDVRRAA